ncbi:hypothetical protein STRDD13_00888 [Streptococcus sp. DD13]|nr:hypothetical protein STRDD13_00888 [Streptococcus sp. DD13]
MDKGNGADKEMAKANSRFRWSLFLAPFLDVFLTSVYLSPIEAL